MISIMGKETVLSFVLNVLLFVLKVIFFRGNFVTCFLQSHDKWEYSFNRNIFISDFKCYYVFSQSNFFLLQQRTTYLLYRFTQKIVFFYLGNCYITHQSMMNNLSFISNNVKGIQAIPKRIKIF